jgi:hypothetical protein
MRWIGFSEDDALKSAEGADNQAAKPQLFSTRPEVAFHLINEKSPRFFKYLVEFFGAHFSD